MYFWIIFLDQAGDLVVKLGRGRSSFDLHGACVGVMSGNAGYDAALYMSLFFSLGEKQACIWRILAKTP